MKKIIALLLSGLVAIQSPISLSYAHNVNLPDIGTAAVTTLSIPQEIEMGDYYTRLFQGGMPIINDPLISQYINGIGQRLVDNADSVQTPFQFYVMNSNVLNAFAYFGGNIVIHSRLILDTDNESQLASVMSHEIGHVTQRHLARAMEDRSKSSPYFWGATLGSLLLALASPEAGIAAMSTTIAGTTQRAISFTQSNEQEADRTGLKTLVKAGFDPNASAEFLQKLSDEARFMSSMPEMLYTHPLPDSRLSDVRNRSNQYPTKTVASSLDYYLVKARLVAMIGKNRQNNKNTTQLLLDSYKKINTKDSNIAATYIEALVDFGNQDYLQAKNKLQPLLTSHPDNIWFIDLMTDIDLGLQKPTEAIARLQAALKKDPDNKTLQINLANVYVEAKEYQKATSLLHRYTYDNKNDINGWDILSSAYQGLKQRAQEMSAQAEILALQGQFPQAITLLQSAKNQAKGNQIIIARIEARIVELQQLQTRYAVYKR